MENQPSSLKGNGQNGRPARLADFDRVLEAGLKRGPQGRREAIVLLRARLPGVAPGDVWKRLRRIKEHGNGHRSQEAGWTSEALRVLEEGYRLGGRRKSEAISLVLEICPGLTRHAVSKHARQQGWGGNSNANGEAVGRFAWDSEQERRLFDLAGYAHAREIAAKMGRTETAIRCRLAASGISAKVKDGYSLRWLQKNLHIGLSRLHEYIASESLRVRDPRISTESLLSFLNNRSAELSPGVVDLGASVLLNGPDGYSRRKAAELLAVALERVEELIANGELKVLDSFVTDRAFEDFLRKCGSELNCELMHPRMKKWLIDEYGLEVKPDLGSNLVLAARKHALKERLCPKCGRAIRGNVYFVHLSACERKQGKQKQEAIGRRERSTGDAISAA